MGKPFFSTTIEAYLNLFLDHELNSDPEITRKKIVGEILTPYLNIPGCLGLFARVSAFSQLNEVEKQWIQLGSPVSEDELNRLVKTFQMDGSKNPVETSEGGYLAIGAVGKELEHGLQSQFAVARFKGKASLQAAGGPMVELCRTLAKALRLLRKQLDRQAVAQMNDVLTSPGEKDQILDKVAEIIIKHTRSAGAKIYMLRQKNKGLRIQRYVWGEKRFGSKTYEVERKLGRADWVMTNNRWLLIDRPAGPVYTGIKKERGYSDNDQLSLFARREKVEPTFDRESSVFLYPLQIQAQVQPIGVLSVWRMGSWENGLDFDDIYNPELDLDCLRELAAPVTAGSRWQILHSAIQEKADELARFGKFLAAGRSHDEVHHEITASTARLAKVARACLILKDPVPGGPYFSVADWTISEEGISRVQGCRWKFLLEKLEPLSLAEHQSLFELTGKKLTLRKKLLSIEDKDRNQPKGIMLLLDYSREPHENALGTFDKIIANQNAEAFLAEAMVMMENNAEAFAQNVGQAFNRAYIEKSAELHNPVDIFQFAANFIREKTGSDAVLVYKATSEDVEVGAVAPENKNVLGWKQGNLTKHAIRKRQPFKILDVHHKSNPYAQYIDSEVITDLTKKLNWERIRSWVSFPIFYEDHLVGAFTLLTSMGGVYLGEWYINFLKKISQIVTWEMSQINIRHALNSLNKVSTDLVIKEGKELATAMEGALSKWTRKFIGFDVQFAVVASVYLEVPKVFASSKNFESKLGEMLEGMASGPNSRVKKTKIQNDFCIEVPIRVFGSSLRGSFFVLHPKQFTRPNGHLIEEVGREIAVVLERERRRMALTHQIGLFRHALIGPVQGLISASRNIYKKAKVGSISLVELEKLKNSIETEAQFIRLWRENQRLYLNQDFQLFKRGQSLVDVVYMAKRRFMASFRGRGIEIKINHVNPKDRLVFSFDREGIDLALSNLMDNALKYSFFNQILFIGMKRIKHGVSIWVEDVGHPIPKNLGKYIWDLGMRLNWADPIRAIQGTGLGLPMVKKIVEGHHGRVTYTSTPLITSSHLNKKVEKPGETEIIPHRVRFTIHLPTGDTSL